VTGYLEDYDIEKIKKFINQLIFQGYLKEQPFKNNF